MLRIMDLRAYAHAKHLVDPPPVDDKGIPLDDPMIDLVYAIKKDIMDEIASARAAKAAEKSAAAAGASHGS